MYIYVATSYINKLQNIIKIGYSADPRARLKSLRTALAATSDRVQEIYFIGLWKTKATAQSELEDYEAEVHLEFDKYRLKWDHHGDTEWFRFPTLEYLEVIDSFICQRQWFDKKIDLNKLPMSKKYLRNIAPAKNIKLLDGSVRLMELQKRQLSVIKDITAFLRDADRIAGIVVAPCGFGKTRIACKSLTGYNRVIIYCPSIKIQDQWIDDIVNYSGVFDRKDIYKIGGDGSEQDIDSIFELEKYCIISTNHSSKKLIDHIDEKLQLLIIDEAHHMAGVLAKGRQGEGITRALFDRCCQLKIKRLSLTFTPRYIANIDTQIRYISMDDSKYFGDKISEISLRELIDAGLLPNYRICCLYDDNTDNTGIIGKCNILLDAWTSSQTIRHEESTRETYLLNKLIIFARTVECVKNIKQYMEENCCDGSEVISLVAGDDVNTALIKFKEAKRAILINCKVLGEGVDIPCADSVAIVYPKKSKSEITQMCLRPGRWYKNKKIFHIIIPVLPEEDLSAFESVLYSLSEYDGKIFDEVILKSRIRNNKLGCGVGDVNEVIYRDSDLAENIVMDIYNSNTDDVVKCFNQIKNLIFRKRSNKEIQKYCFNRNIRTSRQYEQLRKEITDLPEDPRIGNMSWFDYLNSDIEERIRLDIFANEYLIKNNIRSAEKYDEWQRGSDLQVPTLQNINDGYFGEINNFNSILLKYCPKIDKRR